MVKRLNELEYVRGEIWANIWFEDRIARISPVDGNVLGWIDLSELYPHEERGGRGRAERYCFRRDLRPPVCYRKELAEAI